MHHVIHVKKFRKTFTFTVERRGSLDLWRIRWRWFDWVTPIRVTGSEEPDFFRELAVAAWQRMCETRD